MNTLSFHLYMSLDPSSCGTTNAHCDLMIPQLRSWMNANGGASVRLGISEGGYSGSNDANRPTAKVVSIAQQATWGSQVINYLESNPQLGVEFYSPYNPVDDGLKYTGSNLYDYWVDHLGARQRRRLDEAVGHHLQEPDQPVQPAGSAASAGTHRPRRADRHHHARPGAQLRLDRLDRAGWTGDRLPGVPERHPDRHDQRHRLHRRDCAGGADRDLHGQGAGCDGSHVGRLGADLDHLPGRRGAERARRPWCRRACRADPQLQLDGVHGQRRRHGLPGLSRRRSGWPDGGTAYTDMGAVSGSIYTYTVAARDAAGNLSPSPARC